MMAPAVAAANGWVDAERAAMRGAGGVEPIWLPNPWAAGGARVLNIGCGARPVIDAVNHDRRRHSPWVDEAWDLEVLPWRSTTPAPPATPAPPDGGEFLGWRPIGFDVVIAHDVIEHMTDALGFVNEVHALLKPGGLLIMRGGAWDNPATYIDPTHKHWFHEDSFDFFDRERGLGNSYGRFYTDAMGRPLTEWRIDGVDRTNSDYRYGVGDITWTMVRL